MNLNPPLRVLLAVIGTIATACGLVVGAAEVGIVVHYWQYWPAALAALVCVIVALGGITLLRGAIRGRIAVRSIR